MRAFPDRVRALISFVILASLIAAFGSGIWTALIISNLATNPIVPWAVPVMALVLWLMWQYLGGRWWPRSTSADRRAHLRSYAVPVRVFAWAMLAGVLSLVALAGFWIVLVELTGAGGNPTIPDYARYPVATVVLALLMGSLVSPITEEAAFRGYGQVILESAFPAAVAIALSSVLFALWHGPTQGFVWSKLLFFFVVGLSFGTIAYLTNSTLPALPVHVMGDLIFFFLIWPNDAARPLVWRDGADVWFWSSLVTAVIFAFLTILAFRQLAGTTDSRAKVTWPSAVRLEQDG